MRAFALLAAAAAGACVAGQPAAPPPEPISTEVLLAELSDLAKLAEWPVPPFRCSQASSYDRRSISAGDSEGWFANHDAGNFLRAEPRGGRTEYVMMDAAGPGAIVRIWSANPAGRLRIYLDGGATPVLDVPMRDLLGGQIPGIPPPLAGERSRGWNCYYPIAYARRCVVTVDAGSGLYYHINYRTYPAGVGVRSFAPADLQTCAAAAYAQAAVLAFPGELRAPDDDAQHRATLRIAAGEAHSIDRAGPGAIASLVVSPRGDGRDAALRSTLLRIRFDGEQTVECPLGEFFGGGPGVNPYASLPMGVEADGRLWSRWHMPFREKATITFENRGAAPIELEFSVRVTETPWTDRSLYFHAGWRTGRDVPTRPMIDWNYAGIEGRGVFVGAAFSIFNPVRDWWGEGDEKIYVDDDVFPSTFGTGTEDYFGYAWCSPQPFVHAYHAQPRCDGPGNYGLTTVNRWHVPDRIPFERRFRFDMEFWHWNADARVTMAVATYAYVAPGARVDAKPLTAADLEMPQMPPYQARRVADAIEGEEMEVIAFVGTVEPQDIGGCSNDRHLWWRGGQPGDVLTLRFDPPRAGRYRICARTLRAADYGIHRVRINGEVAVAALDSYAGEIRHSEELDWGVFPLGDGPSELSIEVVGKHLAASNYLFGLDFLRLEPVP